MMSEWILYALRTFAGIVAVSVFLFLPEGVAWEGVGGLLYGLLIQFGMPGAEDVLWLTHSGAGRRERLPARGAVVLSAWLGAWLFWPGLDIVIGMDRLPGAPFVAGSLLGAVIFFYGATAMPLEGD